MYLIQVRILHCFRRVVLLRREVRVLLLEEDRVEEGDNMFRIHLSRKYSPGNSLVMPQVSVPFSTQFGRKRVHGVYGKAHLLQERLGLITRLKFIVCIFHVI